MRLNRDLTIKLNWFFDNIVPPFFRDSRWLMKGLIAFFFEDKADLVLDFKKNCGGMTESELKLLYEVTEALHIQRQTDLNRGCVEKIYVEIEGESVLDIACGTGFVCKSLLEKFPELKVTGADIVAPRSHHQSSYVETSLTSTPFADASFDTVISAHTLEHIVDIKKAVDELRRIAKKRLLVVLPRQRAYRYTFDLHVHFFPYEYCVLNLFQPKKDYELSLIGGDWFYIENYEE